MLIPRCFLAATLPVVIGGCAALPRDQGLGDVQRMVVEHSGQELPTPDAAFPALVTEFLATPLGPDSAVQLALLGNPAIRREAARLGFAAAELYDAGRLANPVLAATRLAPGDSAAANAQLTLDIAFNFVNLLFLPANTRYAGARFEAAKLDFAAAVLDLAAQVEAAYYQAVGAEQLAQMREAVARAARASADLAQRFFEAGNLSRRELALEQAAASQAQLDVLSARAAALEARSAVHRTMGLSAAQDHWQIDARLPEPLPQEDALDALQELAAASRLDVAAARRNAQALADRFGLERRTRLIGSVQIGVQREKDFDGSINVGPTLELELPLFNWGGGRVAAARAALTATEAELDQLVLDSGNAVQLAHARVASAKARAAAYRGALIPQRETALAEAQKEQNFMLIGIFELILAKQQEYDAYAGYIEAVRDYWSARAELTRAVGRRLPSSQQSAKPTLDPVDVLRPKSGGMNHSQHSMGGMKGMEGVGDMEGMDMKGMEGQEGMDMKGMPAMHHSQPGKPVTTKPGFGAGDDRGDMPMQGMDHGNMGGSDPTQESAPAKAGPDCTAMQDMDLSKVDPGVAKAMQEQCKGAGKSGNAADAAPVSGPDPHAGQDKGDMPMKGMDHAMPESKTPPEKPQAVHAH